MRTMFAFAVMLGIAISADVALAKPVSFPISTSDAKANCNARGGGGTVCGWCNDGGHCFEVTCNSKNQKCTKTILDKQTGPKKPGPSGTSVGAKGSANGSTSAGLKHPVITPPTNAGTNKGSSRGSTIAAGKSSSGKH